MTDEKWQEIIGKIKDNFELTSHETKELDEEDGPGEVEVVEFNGPLGKMKLERTTKPLIIDKKTIGSRRIGSDTAVEYVYSETEKTHKFTAYKWDENDKVWVEMKMDRGEMIF